MVVRGMNVVDVRVTIVVDAIAQLGFSDGFRRIAFNRRSIVTALIDSIGGTFPLSALAGLAHFGKILIDRPIAVVVYTIAQFVTWSDTAYTLTKLPLCGTSLFALLARTFIRSAGLYGTRLTAVVDILIGTAVAIIVDAIALLCRFRLSSRVPQRPPRLLAMHTNCPSRLHALYPSNRAVQR